MKGTIVTITRRRFIRTSFATLAAGVVGIERGAAYAQSAPAPQHTLPPLPYDYAALEPYIDEQTMRLHHGRHHAAYVTNLNTALRDQPALQGRDIVDLLFRINDVPEAIRTSVRNNGGGHLNHAIFWATMGPKGGGQPVGTLAEALTTTFGSFTNFQAQLNDMAMRRFGSGWAWLVLDRSGALQVISRPNQDAPVMDGLHALVGVDVWEHAYYLKYQNRRADYLAAWWNVVNWEAVAQRFEQMQAAVSRA
jgi:superoxide dismutase, Fe-Mn family